MPGAIEKWGKQAILNTESRIATYNLKRHIVAKVEIFTAQGCGYCSRALRLLQSKDIAFEHTDVTLSSSLRATLRSRAGGATSVPQIFIDDDHIGGCDELMQLDRLGHLDKLLQS